MLIVLPCMLPSCDGHYSRTTQQNELPEPDARLSLDPNQTASRLSDGIPACGLPPIVPSTLSGATCHPIPDERRWTAAPACTILHSSSSARLHWAGQRWSVAEAPAGAEASQAAGLVMIARQRCGEWGMGWDGMARGEGGVGAGSCRLSRRWIVTFAPRLLARCRVLQNLCIQTHIRVVVILRNGRAGPPPQPARGEGEGGREEGQKKKQIGSTVGGRERDREVR